MLGDGALSSRLLALCRSGLWVGCGRRRRFPVPAAAEELLLIEVSVAVLRKFLVPVFFAADSSSYCRGECCLCLGADVGAMVQWQLVDAAAALTSAADVEAGEQDFGEDLNRDGFQWCWVELAVCV